jgi:hypothetical protein
MMPGWFAGFVKLRVRFERRLDIHEARLKLATAIICARFVYWWCWLLLKFIAQSLLGQSNPLYACSAPAS